MTLKFAAHVLMFDCDQLILRMIDNCAPFVDKIYVAYSEVPWTYNPKARSLYQNPTNKEILQTSKFRDKVNLIEGDWEHEIDQRNECLKMARNDGFDYLIIQDSDEFYTDEAYRRNISGICKNPNFDVYTTPWYVFWKSLDYVLEHRNQGTLGTNPAFAINCRREVKFDSGRTSSTKNIYHLDGICHHLAYVMSDEKMYRKISTWGHSAQFNRDSWFYRKWLRWTPRTRNLHPITPGYWPQATAFSGKVPAELGDLSLSDYTSIAPTFSDLIWDWTVDQRSHTVESLRVIKKFLSKGL